MLLRCGKIISAQNICAFSTRTTNLDWAFPPLSKRVWLPEISLSTLTQLSNDRTLSAVEIPALERLRRLEVHLNRNRKALEQNASLLKRAESREFKDDSLDLATDFARLNNLIHATDGQVKALQSVCASIQHRTGQNLSLDFARWDSLDSSFIEKLESFRAPFNRDRPLIFGTLANRRHKLLRFSQEYDKARSEAREELAKVISNRTLRIIERAESESKAHEQVVILKMKRSKENHGQGDTGKRRKLNAKPTPSSLAECGTSDVLEIESRELLSTVRFETVESEDKDPPLPLQFSVGRINSSTQPDGRLENGAEQSLSGKKHEARQFHEFELYVEEFSSTGEGLARHPNQPHVYVIPFALPGEKVRIKAAEPTGRSAWSKADFLELITPSKLRAGTTPQCQYFSKCGGCQLQMVSYEDQLKFKRTIVQEAYRNFSGLDSSQIPEIGPTGGSPLQYGYRTKLTPHFDGPKKGTRYTSDTVPPIGFTRKNFQKVMDIENCPIGTPILQKGLRAERAKIINRIGEYKRGATVLLRETTDRLYGPADTSGLDGDAPTAISPLPPNALQISDHQIESSTTDDPPTIQTTYLHSPPITTIHDTKTYTTNNESLATEHIGAYTFKTRAGSFFQNNNSILPSFLSYVRSRILPQNVHRLDQPIKYLLDAYCGSGLFALTLSPLFRSVLGIEIDPHGVTSARANAELNNITNCGFIEADAAALFEDVPFPAGETALVIDPPRKGCSVGFLRQLLRYGPGRVVYVSCNVGTQARDVGCLVRGWVGEDWWKDDEGGVGGGNGNGTAKEVGRWRYEVEEVRGFDFFPQTGHVEGLAVLRRVENEGWKDGGLSGENEGTKGEAEKGVEEVKHEIEADEK